jgi:predicted RecB family nuclease
MRCESTNINGICDIFTDPLRKDIINDDIIYYKSVSDFMVYCERFISDNEKDRKTKNQDDLFKQSKIHKQDMIERSYPRCKITAYASREEGFKVLLKGMCEGIDRLCDLPVSYMPEQLETKFDILERSNIHPSLFGDYHYILLDIIMAKKENICHHVHQGAFHNYILGKIQQYTPPVFYLIDVNGEKIPIKYAKIEEELKKMIREIRDIYGGKEVTPTYDASEWPWKTYTNKEAEKTHDVSLVSGIGSKIKEKLVEKGIKTVDDLTKADPEYLMKIKGISKEKAKKFTLRANSIAKNKYKKLRSCKFPSNTTEIFLDFEDITERWHSNRIVDIVYLIGVVTIKDKKAEYTPFFVHQLDKERDMFDKFMKWLLNYENFTLYHFTSHEVDFLKKLAERHGLPARTLDTIIGNMIDIYREATQAYVFPTYRNSLKHIAAYTGYTWKHADVDALECAALYLQYIEDPDKNKDNLQKILDYNEDDCKALFHLKEWL